MPQSMVLPVLLLLACRLSSAETYDPTAFPGAEGYGRFSKGGRGGDVYHVTTAADDGQGSLRDAIRTIKPGTPRTVVFETGGTVRLKKALEIKGVRGLTLAGQTAPGGGIAVADHAVKFSDCEDVVVRHMRFRLGDRDRTSDDVIELGSGTKACRNFILDHVSATWGVDGIMDAYSVDGFTMQWCLFGEALNDSTHHKREPHAMLMSFRTTRGNVSIHHNLLFSSRDRHPTLGGGLPAKSNVEAIFDFRNNVIYNWEGACNLASGRFSLVGNLWRPGPDTRPYEMEMPIAPKAEAQDVTRGWLDANVFEGHEAWSRDNYLAFQWGVRGGKYVGEVTREKFILAREPTSAEDRPITHPATELFERVLSHAGAGPARDSADKRIVQGVRDRTNRRIDSQDEVGGWPELAPGKAPEDRDRDGMADAWESSNGLDPADPTDRNRRTPDGRTWLETYLHDLTKVGTAR